MHLRHMLFIGLTALFIEGCLLQSQRAATPQAKMGEAAVPAAVAPGKIYFRADDGGSPVEQVRVSAVGYGAAPKKYYPENQRKLMAMRAAKLDAYRTLAERIQGLHVVGGSTVGELVLEQEQFQTMLDGFVLGAKVLSVLPVDEGTYEAVVETVVDQDFLNRVMAQRSAAPSVAKTAHADKPVEKTAGEKVTPAKTGKEGYSVGKQPNFYYSEAL